MLNRIFSIDILKYYGQHQAPVQLQLDSLDVFVAENENTLSLPPTVKLISIDTAVILPERKYALH